MFGFSPFASAPLGDDGVNLSEILATASGSISLTGASQAANLIAGKSIGTEAQIALTGAAAAAAALVAVAASSIILTGAGIALRTSPSRVIRLGADRSTGVAVTSGLPTFAQPVNGGASYVTILNSEARSMSDVFLIKRNDTSPVLEAQLKGADLQPMQILGATVLFKMGTTDGTQLVDGGVCTIVDAETGIVRYPWAAGDTSEAGTHRGEFEVTFFDGRIETFPRSQSAAKNFIRIVIPEDV